MSNQTLPFDPAVSTKRARGSLFVEVSVALNCFQPAFTPPILTGLQQDSPSLFSKVAVSGPSNPSAQRAQKDKLNFSPSFMPIPQKPLFAMPSRPLFGRFSISSRHERGVPVLSGLVMSRFIEPSAPPSLTSDQNGRPLVK